MSSDQVIEQDEGDLCGLCDMHDEVVKYLYSKDGMCSKLMTAPCRMCLSIYSIGSLSSKSV
jgi:hypothetical protein